MRENHSESFWNSITEKSHLILGFLAFWSHSSWKRDYKKGFKKTKMHIFEAFCHQNPEIKMSKMQFSAKSPFCLSLFSRENYKTGCVLSFFWLFWASFSNNTKKCSRFFAVLFMIFLSWKHGAQLCWEYSMYFAESCCATKIDISWNWEFSTLLTLKKLPE